MTPCSLVDRCQSFEEPATSIFRAEDRLRSFLRNLDIEYTTQRNIPENRNIKKSSICCITLNDSKFMDIEINTVLRCERAACIIVQTKQK